MRFGMIVGATALIIPLGAWLALAQSPQSTQNVAEFTNVPPGPVLNLELPGGRLQAPQPPQDPIRGQGQKPGPDLPKQPIGDKKVQPVPPGPEIKDPTEPSPKLKDLLNVGKTMAPGQASYKLPTLVLRGRIISKDRPPAAVVEMDGRIYVLGKDSILPGLGNVMLRVDDINNVEVRIEVMPFKEMLSLR